MRWPEGQRRRDDHAYADVRATFDVAVGVAIGRRVGALVVAGRGCGGLGGIDGITATLAELLHDLHALPPLLGGKLRQPGQLGLGNDVFVGEATAHRGGKKGGEDAERDVRFPG
jgi:hypothetical protein